MHEFISQKRKVVMLYDIHQYWLRLRFIDGDASKTLLELVNLL